MNPKCSTLRRWMFSLKTLADENCNKMHLMASHKLDRTKEAFRIKVNWWRLKVETSLALTELVPLTSCSAGVGTEQQCKISNYHSILKMHLSASFYKLSYHREVVCCPHKSHFSNLSSVPDKITEKCLLILTAVTTCTHSVFFQPAKCSSDLWISPSNT